jgi:hypothetical protein
VQGQPRITTESSGQQKVEHNYEQERENYGKEQGSPVGNKDFQVFYRYKPDMFKVFHIIYPLPAPP